MATATATATQDLAAALARVEARVEYLEAFSRSATRALAAIDRAISIVAINPRSASKELGDLVESLRLLPGFAAVEVEEEASRRAGYEIKSLKQGGKAANAEAMHVKLASGIRRDFPDVEGIDDAIQRGIALAIAAEHRRDPTGIGLN